MLISLHLRHFLLILSCILLTIKTYSKNDRKTYIVYLGEQPKDAKSTESHHMSMVQNVLGSDFAPEVLLHSYKKSFNGFVVKLREDEAERMARMDGVVSIFRSKKNNFQTTRSWDFLGFSQQVKRTSVESDVIVGVIDSGIWPESDSFSDKGFGPPPSKWKGTCHNFTCNNKIVGAKYFRIDGQHDKDDISPRDSEGHGTHTASTVAGNLVSSASLFGLASGTARGGVPSARIAVYKVCWHDGCDDHDILAAFQAAIADGVDIISISIGGDSPRRYFDDPIAIGAYHAMQRGILTSNPAGNSGPNLYTMTTLAPWLLSVAASTIDRKFFTKVRLGKGMVLEGVSVNTFDLKNKTYPLIYGRDAANMAGGYNSSINASSCHENSLDENLVKGKIVLCNGFIKPSKLGLASGAAGVVFGSTSPIDVARTFAVPATILGEKDTELIQSYVNSRKNPTATIFRSNQGRDSVAPYIASFSSRGPDRFTPDILKPDIAAPGVDILAAWSPANSVSRVKGDIRVTNYNIISGTSMACPHATASTVYVKSFHSKWSPAAIKPALMTTATPMVAALNPEAELAYGAGQINPIKAVNPGLVYDASEMDYLNFLCAQDYVGSCMQANHGTVWDLNLPSFVVFTSSSTFIDRTFHRTVTNVGSETSTYKAKVIGPRSLEKKIQVNPDVLSFSSLGQKKSFELRFNGGVNGGIVSASLIWDDGTFQVRSPIVVY